MTEDRTVEDIAEEILRETGIAKFLALGLTELELQALGLIKEWQQ